MATFEHLNPSKPDAATHCRPHAQACDSPPTLPHLIIWKPAETSRPLFVVGRPFDGGAAEAGNGQMVALLAPDRPMVERIHAMALAQGATCEGKPGLRPHYHADYYGAYFRDPDGNKLCIVCHDPQGGIDA